MLKIRLRLGGAEWAGLIYLAIVLLAIGGWIANVVKIVGSDFNDITGLLVIRIIGVFMAPLGAVLGFF